MGLMSENILTVKALDEFLIKDIGGLRVLGLLKIIDEDGILFSPGLTSHKLMAIEFDLLHSKIGFAGRVHGWLDKDGEIISKGLKIIKDETK